MILPSTRPSYWATGTPIKATASRDRPVGSRWTDTHRSRSQRKRYDHRTDHRREQHRAPFEQFIAQVGKNKLAKVSSIGEQGWGKRRKPIYRIDVPSTGRSPTRILILAKLHGNELVGRDVAMKIVQRAMKSKRFRERFHLTIFPELNVFDRREAPGLLNQNREFPPRLESKTIRALLRSLSGETFDGVADLHSAPKDGFFVVRHLDDKGLSRRFLSALNSAALADRPPEDPGNGAYMLTSLGNVISTIGGTSKAYFSKRWGAYCYTFEGPEFLPLKQQVQGMTKLVESFMNHLAKTVSR